jgi:hypothetical protein
MNQIQFTLFINNEQPQKTKSEGLAMIGYFERE